MLNTYEPTGPKGAIKVGEGATNPTFGMFSNAIFDAMKGSVNSLPLTYEKNCRVLKEKRERDENSQLTTG